MWRPLRSIRRFSLERISAKISDAIHALLLEKNSHLQRRELSFNDLKQRGLRLLPTTIRAAFSPDAVTKKAQVVFLGVFTTMPAFSALIDQRALIPLVHLNDHPSLTEFLD